MEKLYHRLWKQFRLGMKSYSADSLEDFVQNRKDVKHGVRGISTFVNGVYNLNIESQFLGQMPFGTIDPINNTIIIEMKDAYDYSSAKLTTQFQNKTLLDITVPPMFYMKNQINPTEAGVKAIKNPVLLYSKCLNEKAILVDIHSYKQPPKKIKKRWAFNFQSFVPASTFG